MKTPQTFVIGDIHGGLKALQQLIIKLKLAPKDHLIFLGDYVDGWSESANVIDFLMELRKIQPCTFIKGNHDALCLEWLTTGVKKEEWLRHGGLATVESYRGYSQAEIDKHISFIEQSKNYYITPDNRLFLHAGFTHLHGPEREYFKDMCFWDRSLWEMALALNPNLSKKDPFYPNRLLIFDEIFIGHTPVTRLGKTTPVNAVCIWNVDTGAAFKGPLTALNINTKEYIQSDPVYAFYPDERGRN